MKTLIFVLVTALSGCAYQYSCVSNFEAGGLSFCVKYEYTEPENELDAAIVEQIVQIVEEEASVTYPEVVGLRDTLEQAGVVVLVEGTELYMGCHQTDMYGIRTCMRIAGANEGGYNIILAHDTKNVCLADSALAHELLHSIQVLYLKVQLNHTTPNLFIMGAEKEEQSNTIEYRIRQRTILLCPTTGA
jgi:hypothetical protein